MSIRDRGRRANCLIHALCPRPCEACAEVRLKRLAVVTLRPASLKEANALVRKWHSHHKAVKVARFQIAAEDEGELAGVVIVGNPKAAALQDGRTFEVVRLCTNDKDKRVTDRHGKEHAKGTAALLLGAAWRASKAMGVHRLISYIRHDEAGICYKAAGWRKVADVEGRGWDGGNKGLRWLPGLYEPTTEIVDRERWEVSTIPAVESAEVEGAA